MVDMNAHWGNGLTNAEAIEHSIADIFTALGYDLEDQHMKKTPERMRKWLELFAANGDDAHGAELLQAQFDDEHDSMVVVGPIKYQSMCAHHALPVTGQAWVGYIPQKKVVGLSKLARITHYYANQFTVQERVTQQIANLLEAELEPVGTMVVVEAEHGCMTLRGVKETSALTTTSAVRGAFKESAARTEFMTFIQNSRR